MDLLSWFLLIWILGTALVFLFVQNVLPHFLPPVESHAAQSSTSSTIPIDRRYSSSKIDHDYRSESTSIDASRQQQQQSTTGAFSSWAASTLGAHLGGQGSSDWINDLLIWLYRNMRQTPDFTQAWLRAMNDASSKVAPAAGCDVFFEELIAAPDDTKDGPKLSAIRSEFGPREHLTMRANLTYPKMAVRLVASQKLPDRLLVSNYTAVLKNLNGQAHVRIACIGDDLFFMLCFEGKPELTITLENGDQAVSERVDQSLVDDIIKKCLASAVTNISLAKLQDHSLQQQQIVTVSSKVPIRNGHRGSIVVSPEDIKQCQAVTLQERQRSNRLLLKVDKAEKLGGGKPPAQPYVVVELDEPAQKHTTTLGFKGNPVWEEQFLFELNDRSEEILFEVYDRPAAQSTILGGGAPMAAVEDTEPRFLGLAIVGVDELRQAVNSTHTLALQARPYKDDSVTGTLTVEFIFLREQFFADSTTTRSASKTTRLTTPAINGEGHETTPVRPLQVVTTDFRPVSGGMKTAQDSPYIDQTTDDEPPPPHLHTTTIDRRPPQAPPRVRGTSSYGSTVTGASTSTKSPPSPSSRHSLDRGRKRERSFFDDLKQRLSFRKSSRNSTKRAHSLEADINGSRGEGAGAHGAGAGVQLLQHGGATGGRVTFAGPGGGRSVSTPASRDTSQTRRRIDHTPMTSDSEMSVTSTDSVYHQSQLIVEVVEDAVKKHYLLPVPVQRHTIGKRLMKAGKKLHVYNEHTFTAVKTRAGSTCGVCNSLIATAFRRKGYQCRDCGFICHKRCHFKVDEKCPFSKVSSLQLEVVKIT